jgi:hypothetical protein
LPKEETTVPDEPLDLKRAFKSSFFASLFNDQERGLELVNAILDTNYPPDTKVTIQTLSDVFFMGIQNDLALLAGDTVLFLGEHQSTINRSIPVRFISYYGRVLERMVERDRTYIPGIVDLPKPVFIVLYNGKDPYPAKSILKLSDSYKKLGAHVVSESFIELAALVYNIHSPENADLLGKSPYLYGYVEVVRRGREYQAQGMTALEAVKRAIQDCIQDGIIADYLKKHAAEVEGMLSGEFNWEDARRALLAYGEERGFQKGAREGMAKGVEKGVQEGMERGMERGIVVGMERGIVVGMERGIVAGMEKERQALALRLRGLPLDISAVVSITGLGEDEIRQLWYPLPDSTPEFPNI